MLCAYFHFVLKVGGGGLEPPNPEGADLQSAAIATMRTSQKYTESPTRFELVMKVLQTFALPTWPQGLFFLLFVLVGPTGLQPALCLRCHIKRDSLLRFHPFSFLCSAYENRTRVLRATI